MTIKVVSDEADVNTLKVEFLKELGKSLLLNSRTFCEFSRRVPELKQAVCFQDNGHLLWFFSDVGSQTSFYGVV